jgi:hypothetical protein
MKEEKKVGLKFTKNLDQKFVIDGDAVRLKTFCLLLFVHESGLPDGIFSNQNPNLDKFWSVLQCR